MEKWAVWAASPRRTTLPCHQRSLTTVRKVVHADLLDFSGRPPDLLAHLDDDGRGVGRVGVAVQLHHAVLGLGDVEAEGVEGEVGGEPDVAAAVGGEAGAERVAVGRPGGAVYAVGGDDEVVLPGQAVGVRGLGAKAQLDAEGAAAVVQDLQEPAAAEGGETVSAGGLAGASVDDVDVVPADEVGLEGRVDGRVGVFDAAEGLVGEDHSEAEGVVGGVAFPDGDLAVGGEAFEEGGGVEAAGASADDRDAVGVLDRRRRPRGRRGRSRPAAEPHIDAVPRP
jgi:hypothetical protein